MDNAVYAETDSLITDCDMFMTIGGDGTILKWGQKAAACNKLLLGINTGRLGFMTSIESGELDTLERLKTGEYTVSRRMMLDIEYEGKGNYSAINDVVFSKCRYSKLPEFIVSVEEYEVTKSEPTELSSVRRQALRHILYLQEGLLYPLMHSALNLLRCALIRFSADL